MNDEKPVVVGTIWAKSASNRSVVVERLSNGACQVCLDRPEFHDEDSQKSTILTTRKNGHVMTTLLISDETLYVLYLLLDTMFNPEQNDTVLN